MYLGHYVIVETELLLSLILPRLVQVNMENQKGKTKHFTASSAVHYHANNELRLAFISLTILIYCEQFRGK